MKTRDYIYSLIFLTCFVFTLTAIGIRYSDGWIIGYYLSAKTIKLIALFSGAFLFASFEGARDANRIYAHKIINHTRNFLFRISVGGLFVWIIDAGILQLIGAAFFFSAIFSYVLNSKRGYPYWYISDSNYWDRLFKWITNHKDLNYWLKWLIEVSLSLIAFA